MRIFRQFLCLASIVMLASSTLAQQRMPSWVTPTLKAEADRALVDERNALVEQILAAKEMPGRELDAAFRKSLADRLQSESIQSLQAQHPPGSIETNALGDSSKDMTYTTLSAPCRIIDTRLGGGPIAANTSRNFFVAGSSGFTGQGGNATGCGIPFGPATAVNINFVAVDPAGGGNLKGSAYPNPIPTTGAVINYQLLSPPMNVANGLVFPICDTTVSACAPADITLYANASSTQVVADVLGYFTKFPKSQIRSFSTLARIFGGPTIGTTCTNYTSIIVNAPVAGRVVVRATVAVNVNHTVGTSDWTIESIATDATTCDSGAEYGFSQYTWVDASAPTGFPFPITHITKDFAVLAGNNTFYINGILISGATNQAFYNAGIEATFYPN